MKMKMKPLSYYLVILFLLPSCQEKTFEKVTSTKEPSRFNEAVRQYYFKTLDSASFHIQQMDTLHSLAENQDAFLKSRKWYKRVEPMLIAYDHENYLSMNAPNLLKVEIDDYTDIKIRKPKSYQVLEEMLFGGDAISNRELHNVLVYLQSRIPYIGKHHNIYRQLDRHHLKMIRDAIVNVATKGITGFDSPMLSNSLTEAIDNYMTLKEILEIYREAFRDTGLYQEWMTELDAAMTTLEQGDFETFDRYTFIKEHTHTQLQLVNATAMDWQVNLNTSRPLNPKADNLFDKDFFNIKMFALPNSPPIGEERVALGRALFNDNALSNEGLMSCATCHLKEKAFTDGQPKALGNNGKPLQRNTPTLSYAVYQKTFFYDGSGDDLEAQIVSVANNENEFHMDLNRMEEQVKANATYQSAFDSLYRDGVTNQNVRNAIATYIRSLAPFDSKFDRNMQGKEESLTQEEVLGFNLFMGKAACATCHFPPAFNGTVPPKYQETEFENLGLPKNASFTHPVLDEDLGQYFPYKVEEKKSFFKTSTVRNIALTGPYMHNGVYKTLEEVMQFYNVGGGQGMGLDVPYQTLPPDSLDLTDRETKAIIAFMRTLTDREFETMD